MIRLEYFLVKEHVHYLPSDVADRAGAEAISQGALHVVSQGTWDPSKRAHVDTDGNLLSCCEVVGSCTQRRTE